MRTFEIIESGKVDHSSRSSKHDVVLHKDILDILFKHKEEVYKSFVDLKGTLLLDHIAIKIINPNNEILIFSITPSVEYNLIVQGLWRHDHSFFPDSQKINKLYLWEEAYANEYFNEIKSIKEIKHGFTFGFNIRRVHGDFNLIYSFATRSKNNNLQHYYRNHLQELCNLGDYSYKLIHNIYSKYCHQNLVPSIANKTYPVRSFLKLVINNK